MENTLYYLLHHFDNEYLMFFNLGNFISIELEYGTKKKGDIN